MSCTSNAVNTFLRNPKTGALQQVQGVAGCTVDRSQPPNPGCATGSGLEGPTAIAISPDGKNVYVTGFVLDTSSSTPRIQGTLVTFRRNAQTGVLTQLPAPEGCFSGDALAVPLIPGCSPALLPNAPPAMAPLATATDVEVSPDGRNVITSSFIQGAVTSWDRNATTGALMPQECMGSTKTLLPAGGGSTGSCPAGPG